MRKNLLCVLFALLFLPFAVQSQSKILRLNVTDVPEWDGFVKEQLSPILLINGSYVGEFHYNNGIYESYVDSQDKESVEFVLWSHNGIAPSAPVKWDISGQPNSEGIYEKTVSMSDYKKVDFSIPSGYSIVTPTNRLSVGRESVEREYRTYQEDGDDDASMDEFGKTTTLATVDGKDFIYAQPGHYYYWGSLYRESDGTTFDAPSVWEFDVKSSGVNEVSVPSIDSNKFTIVTFKVKDIDGKNADSMVEFGTSYGYTGSSYGDGKLRWAVLSGSPLTWRASMNTDEGVFIAPIYGTVETTAREVSVDVDFSSLKKTELRAIGLSNRGFSYASVSFESDGYQRGFMQKEDGSYSLSFYTKSGSKIKGNVVSNVERDYNTVSSPAVTVSTTAGKDVVIDFGKYSYVSFSVEGSDMSPFVSVRKAGTNGVYNGVGSGALLEKGEYEAKCDHYLSDYEMSITLTTEFTVDGSGKDKNVVLSFNDNDYAVLTINVVNAPTYSDGSLSIDFDYEINGEERDTYFSLGSTTTKKLLLKKGEYNYSAEINIDNDNTDDMTAYPIEGKLNMTEDRNITLDFAKYRIVEMDVREGNSLIDYYYVVIDNKFDNELGVDDVSGKLPLLIIPDGSYDIAVAAGGYAMCKKTVTIDANTKKLTFDMTKADCYPLSVYAFDSNNYDGVIPNCTVSVEGVGTITTDKFGYNYVGDLEKFLAVPSGTYKVKASALGYRDYNGEIVVDAAHADEDGWIYFEIDMTELSGVDAVVDATPTIKFDGSILRVDGDKLWSISVYDLNGRVLLQTEKSELNISELPTGIYIAVAADGGEIIRTKVALRH